LNKAFAYKHLGQPQRHGTNEDEQSSGASVLEIRDTGSMHKARKHASSSRSISRESIEETVHLEETAHAEQTVLFEYSEDLSDHAEASDGEEMKWWSRRRRAPVACIWLPYMPWAACSATCGPGSTKRSRIGFGPFNNGEQCSGPTTETMKCQDIFCPRDCKWTEWANWAPLHCPVTCGTGKRIRTREMEEAWYGGKECPEQDMDHIEEACAEVACPIDCEWRDWEAWSPCSVSCGGGTQARARDRNHTMEELGAQCGGHPHEARACGSDACPIDCAVNEWTPWTNCTEDCGGGDRMRFKSILIQNASGGAPCPELSEKGECNLDACPIKAGTKAASAASLALAILFSVVFCSSS